MTRMWAIDPSQLCREHLVGEHAEMHQIVGTIRNHPHGESIVDGHADAGDVDTSLIQQRHDELVSEMERRGFDHDSPMDYDDDLNAGHVDVEDNRRDLRDRCGACERRMIETTK